MASLRFVEGGFFFGAPHRARLRDLMLLFCGVEFLN